MKMKKEKMNKENNAKANKKLNFISLLELEFIFIIDM